MDSQNLSGVPPTVTLSGLDAGQAGGGFSGAGQQSLGGMGGGAGTPFGFEGGMDLAQLMQMLQQQGGDQAGVGTGGDILQSLTQGSLGQQQGGISAGSFGQTQPGYTAGQSASPGGGMQAAQAQAAGSADPFALIQKLLGLSGKAAGMLGGAGQQSQTASPTQGGQGAGGMQATGGEQQAFTTGVASPVNPSDDLMQSGIFQGGLSGGANLLDDPTLTNLFTSGVLNGWDGSPESLATLMASDPSLKQALFYGGGLEGSLGEQMTGGTGGSQGFSLGADNTLDTSLGGQQGVNYGGAAQGGIGGAMGLLNLISGIQGGNPMQATGGSLQGIGGLAQLLQQAGLGGSLGAAGSGLGGMSALGSLGAGAGGLGGLLGLYGGIQSLMEGGDVGSGLMQLASGGLGTYGALSTLLPSIFPSLTASVATAVPSLAPAIAGSAAAAPVAGMVAGPYIVAKLMQLGQSLADQKNVKQLQRRVENIYGQLPGEITTLQGIPGIASQLTADSTPEQAADVLKQLNAMQDQYQSGGWEAYQKAGKTGVQSIGEDDIGADLTPVRQVLDQMNPYFKMMDVGRIRAQDQLLKAGWTPEQIQQATGRYTGPQEWAMNLNAQNYIGGSHDQPQWADFAPTFNTAFRNAALSGMDPEQTTTLGYGLAPGGLTPGMGYTGALATPFGNVSRSMWDELGAMQEGGFEQELLQYLQPYGGVNPGMLQMGFGQGFPQPQPQVPAQQQQAAPQQADTTGLMAQLQQMMAPQQAMSPTGAPQQGVLEQDALMDLIRRMSMGTGGA